MCSKCVKCEIFKMQYELLIYRYEVFKMQHGVFKFTYEVFNMQHNVVSMHLDMIIKLRFVQNYYDVFKMQYAVFISSMTCIMSLLGHRSNCSKCQIIKHNYSVRVHVSHPHDKKDPMMH